MPSRQLSNPENHHRRLIRIGTPLRALLDERFLTQEDLARDLDITSGNVSRWCRNEAGPTKRRLRQVAEYFDVAPAELIDDEATRAAA